MRFPILHCQLATIIVLTLSATGLRAQDDSAAGLTRISDGRLKQLEPIPDDGYVDDGSVCDCPHCSRWRHDGYDSSAYRDGYYDDGYHDGYYDDGYYGGYDNGYYGDGYSHHLENCPLFDRRRGGLLHFMVKRPADPRDLLTTQGYWPPAKAQWPPGWHGWQVSPLSAMLSHRCECTHSPDHGWGRPIKHAIQHQPATYQRYWPSGSGGAHDPGRVPPTSYPTIARPTDTSQLGYYYQHVPQWQPKPGMLPAKPWPSAWHFREDALGPDGKYYGRPYAPCPSCGRTTACGCHRPHRCSHCRSRLSCGCSRCRAEARDCPECRSRRRCDRCQRP